jgi:hypothetical protein
MCVTVQGTPVEKVRSALFRQRNIGKVLEKGDAFEVTMPFEGIPELARVLVQEEVDIQALIPRRSLEEYFLSITESEPEESKK